MEGRCLWLLGKWLEEGTLGSTCHGEVGPCSQVGGLAWVWTRQACKMGREDVLQMFPETRWMLRHPQPVGGEEWLNVFALNNNSWWTADRDLWFLGPFPSLPQSVCEFHLVGICLLHQLPGGGDGQSQAGHLHVEVPHIGGRGLQPDTCHLWI